MVSTPTTAVTTAIKVHMPTVTWRCHGSDKGENKGRKWWVNVSVGARNRLKLGSARLGGGRRLVSSISLTFTYTVG
jgi:hypothetical protein